MLNLGKIIDKERAKESLWYFIATILIGEAFFVIIDLTGRNLFSSIYLTFRLFLIAILFLFLLFGKLRPLSRSIKKFKRENIIPPILTGIVIELFIHKIYLTGLFKYINDHFTLGYFLYFGVCIALFIFLLLRPQEEDEKESDEPFFLSDDPIEDTNEDDLGFADDAEAFAENILKGNSSKSIVFGLNSPWGSGKSSYINLCKKFWEKHASKPIIFNFQPLIYENQQNLFDKFIEDFLGKMGEEIYSPKLRKSIRKYASKIRDYKVNLGGLFEMTFGNGKPSYDKVLDDLKEELKKLGRKIIVIIDDLDRLELKDVKAMVNIVKASFRLPNVSFIICYSTENINSFEAILKKKRTDYYFEGGNNVVASSPFQNISSQATKNYPEFSRETESLENKNISQYFEKIIQVEKILIPGRKKLLEYFNSKIDRMIDPSEHNSLSIEEIRTGFQFFFLPENYPKYAKYICDLRKIKRVLNFIKEADLLSFGRNKSEKIGFDRVDFNFLELLKLVILYINYPHIFNKMYLSETEDCKGLFSAKSKFGDSDRESLGFENSPEYHQYLKELSEDEVFLVKDIFDVEQKRKELMAQRDNSKFRSSTILFNGDFPLNPNLREYLDFIVKKRKPDPEEHYRYFLAEANKIISGVPIDEIMNKFDKEKSTEKVFNSLINISDTEREKISYDVAVKVINYIIENIQNFSLFDEFKGGHEGLRKKLLFYCLLKFLNDKGWNDEEQESRANTPQNVITIAHWIFGENNFQNRGIINLLSKEDKGILGIYDLLCFRYFCSRGGSGRFFNVYSAMAYHHQGFDAKTDGLVSDLMISQTREISQKCFEIFNKYYISLDKNVFEEIFNLSDDDISGRFIKTIKEEYDSKKISFSDDVAKIRFSTASFIVYQLSSDQKDSTVGCGFYNVGGIEAKENGGSIRKEMMRYLFNVCFDIDKDEKNAKYFIDFLLSHLSILNSITGEDLEPKLIEFTRLLDENELRIYWRKNRKKIIKYMEKQDSKAGVITYNYSVTYGEKLKALIDELDDLLKGDKIKDLILTLKAIQKTK